MAEFNGTPGHDVIDQDALGLSDYTTFSGGAGDDLIRFRRGVGFGGQGNDRIEVVGEDWWPIIYADSPAGVVVDLAAGTADDGWGTKDTLVGRIHQVNATGFGDRLFGNAADNVFFTGRGDDFVDGREGFDAVAIPSLGGYDVHVAIDGRTATISARADPTSRIRTVDVEGLLLYDEGGAIVQLADLIDPLDLGRNGLVGTDTQRWNAGQALGSSVEVTFSFVLRAPADGPGAGGFRAFDATEQAAVREVLGGASAVTGLSFREVADAGAGGQIRFGASQQTATKGVAAMPGAADADGDVWMDVDSLRNLGRGGEGFAALIHEIGHALGLRHPRNVDPGDAYADQWRIADDRPGMTVMSSAGAPAGLFRADFGPVDIVALRHLYGSREVATDATRWRFDDTTADALRTLTDDGGEDTIDASGATIGARIDLRDGHLSSIGRTAQGLAAIDNVAITPGSRIEHATGTADDDVISGNALANRLEGGAGNDVIDGGAGDDRAVYRALRADYSVEPAVVGWEVVHRGGTLGNDLLQGVERVEFSDRAIALDLSGAPQAAVRLVGALLGRSWLTPEIIGAAIHFLDAGLSTEELAALALQTPLYAGIAGSTSHADFVRLVWGNLFGVAPSTDDLATYQGLLDRGEATQAGLATAAAGLEITALRIDLLGMSESGVEFVPYPG